jgi:hypothetical protein
MTKSIKSYIDELNRNLLLEALWRGDHHYLGFSEQKASTYTDQEPPGITIEDLVATYKKLEEMRPDFHYQISQVIPDGQLYQLTIYDDFTIYMANDATIEQAKHILHTHRFIEYNVNSHGAMLQEKAAKAMIQAAAELAEKEGLYNGP